MNKLTPSEADRAYRHFQDVINTAMFVMSDLQRLVAHIDFDHNEWRDFVAKHRPLAMELMALQDRYGEKETR